MHSKALFFKDKTMLTINETQVSVADGLYSLNDIHRASGGEKRHGPSYFMESQQTKELIRELETTGFPVFKITQGRDGGTYAHKELVYAYAMWVSPAFAIRVIRTFDAVASGDIEAALKTAGTSSSLKRLERIADEREALMKVGYVPKSLLDFEKDKAMRLVKSDIAKRIKVLVSVSPIATESDLNRMIRHACDFDESLEWVALEVLDWLVVTGDIKNTKPFSYAK